MEHRTRYAVAGLAVALLVATPLAVGVASSAPTSLSSRSGAGAQFLALVQRGDTGTFSATYRVGGERQGSGTLVVAQRAPAGVSAFPGGPGSWSYLYTSATGELIQWVEMGSMSRDCWRPTSTAALACYGPTPYLPFNAFVTATEPFLVGSEIAEVRAALDQPGARLYGTYSRTFGWLRCLRVGRADNGPATWCVNGAGRLVTRRGVVGSTRTGADATLVSLSPVAPLADFAQLGTIPGRHHRFELWPS